MTTKRLYWDDVHAVAFDAAVVAAATWDGKPAIVLDRTLFYPEAGGQLADRGVVRVGEHELAVVDAQIDDDGTIHHVLEAAPPADVIAGARAHGVIDRERRRDHMSQHTAQHMLSRALLDVGGAETISSRLGAQSSTIDLGVPRLADADVARAEDLVNGAILDDRAIAAFFPSESELARLPLRREPKVDREVRVVQVEGFDVSPCGGTHCTRTGEVGPVRVTALERYKGGVRVTFLAGRRALDDYRAKDVALGELARSFTCGPLDVAAAVAKLRSELKARAAELAQAREELARLLADAALAATPVDASGTTRVVVAREGDDVGTLRALAARLAARPDVVAIVGSRERGGRDWAIVVERGATTSFDAGAWMKRAAAAHGGRGGGSAARAEGRLPAAVDLARVGAE